MKWDDGRAPLPPAGLHLNKWRGLPADYAHRRRVLARTMLYRWYDGEGRLLYVGITGNPEARWQGHATSPISARWWPQRAELRTEWYPNLWAAEEAERAAIRREHPLWNCQGSGIGYGDAVFYADAE